LSALMNLQYFLKYPLTLMMLFEYLVLKILNHHFQFQKKYSFTFNLLNHNQFEGLISSLGALLIFDLFSIF
jgi:hypothetical protein